MENLAPGKEDLEPIEYALRDEIPVLQLKRMKQSIRHARDPNSVASSEGKANRVVDNRPKE